MATRNAKPRPSSPPARSGYLSQSTTQPVDPRWLLRALFVAFAAAALLAYLSLCLLVYQGSWQFILHPAPLGAPAQDRTPASIGIPFQPVRFDASATGTPRLTAWWMPGSDPAATTVLFLHDGSGSLPANLPTLALLHQAGVNIFAIDYRGFGASDRTHPTEASMAQDTASALAYLTETRHLPAGRIVPYGTGLGAALAARLALSNAQLPALIVDNPDLHTVPGVIADPRARLLPMRMLVSDRFEIASPLESLRIPRLLIVGGPADSAPHYDRDSAALFKSLSGPRFTVELPPVPAADAVTNPAAFPALSPSFPGPAYVAALRRFLDTYLPVPPETLHLQTPSPRSTLDPSP